MTGNVPAQIIHAFFRFDGQFLRVYNTDGDAGLFFQQAAGRTDVPCRFPVGIVKFYFAEIAVEVFAGVVCFAVAETIEHDRAFIGGFPFFIGCDQQFPLGVPQFQTHLRHIAPARFFQHPHTGGVTVVPAGTEDNADGVSALFQMFGNIMHHITHVFIKAADHGIQHMIAHPFAVDEKFVVAKPADRHFCSGGRGIAGEFLTQIRRRFCGCLKVAEEPAQSDPAGVLISGEKFHEMCFLSVRFR